MEEYEKLMKLFRRECQYAGAARWVLDATLQDLLEENNSHVIGIGALIKRLKIRLEALDIEYNNE
jgi:hypothetical protein